MTKKMLVESDPHETRVAILEDDRLTELFIERNHQLGIVGNVYKGRVSRVLPGMQAAFVDIGLDRDAFLYVSEVMEANVDGEGVEPPTLDAAGEPLQERLGLVGDDPIGRDEEPSIDDLLKRGQEIVVQVLKDAMPNKGARVSTQITLPGRSLVLLPDVPHLGVSRRIDDEDERARLRELLAELSPEGTGLIVRTAGAHAEIDELQSDLDFLERLWRRIQERAAKVSAPTLLHRDLDLALRVVRDSLSEEFSVIWVDGEELYERIVEFVDEAQPELVSRVKLFQQDRALMDQFEIDAEIEAALKTKVWLKSGGHIVIHPTEALVAIDVNTGRYVGHHNLEDTVLTTNLEAVQEIVRQIRLRNLGGIIVIDLIDMLEEEHRREVFEALERELAKDRAKNKVLNISEFGLVELTRKRTRPSLERLLTQSCPYCRGGGRIKSLSTISLELRRQILRQRARYSGSQVLLRVHPDIATVLQREERSILLELERELRAEILLQSDPELHHERFDILEV
ncbi:MAG: Rne/Rng family ribonuclease [Acidobacteriota bacterium]